MRVPAWVPPVIWMALIMALSSDRFSAERTGAVMGPMLTWLFPWASAPQLVALHQAVRKMAHVIEYAMLALLWFRALSGRPARRRAWIALVISAGWAFLDEAHQATTFTRVASATDVALDTSGAVFALAVARAGWRAIDVCTTLLLWLATAGGSLLIAVDIAVGVRASWLWVTVPVAALVLLLRRRARPGS